MTSTNLFRRRAVECRRLAAAARNSQRQEILARASGALAGATKLLAGARKPKRSEA